MRLIRLATLAAAALLAIGAAAPTRDWVSTVTVTAAGSHLQGNPDADVKLAEYVSYTCPHCAHFQKQAAAPLQLFYVRTGKVSVEVRHLVRDPVDLTVAMLTNCGAPSRFQRLHNAFLSNQESWIKLMETATSVQQQRWSNGDSHARLRAIAADFGFYAMMERFGYGRAELNRCLADDAMMRRIVGQTVEAQRLGVQGTPSFFINGTLLPDTFDWPSLDRELKSKL
jgi:protein-disulfide isomerase